MQECDVAATAGIVTPDGPGRRSPAPWNLPVTPVTEAVQPVSLVDSPPPVHAQAGRETTL